MDHRCPLCGTDLGRRRFSQAVVARMEIECPHCKGTIRLNIHRSEVVALTLICGTIIVLAALGYRSQSHGLMLAALGAAMLGALALPLLEWTYLRSWPRYTASSADERRTRR